MDRASCTDRVTSTTRGAFPSVNPLVNPSAYRLSILPSRVRSETVSWPGFVNSLRLARRYWPGAMAYNIVLKNNLPTVESRFVSLGAAQRDY